MKETGKQEGRACAESNYNFRIQRKNQLTVSLKYFILVLLLISLFHTSILSEKTRFGYPLGVPCLAFFCGGVLQRAQNQGGSAPRDPLSSSALPSP